MLAMAETRERAAGGVSARCHVVTRIRTRRVRCAQTVGPDFGMLVVWLTGSLAVRVERLESLTVPSDRMCDDN